MDYLTPKQVTELTQILEDTKERLMRTARESVSEQIENRGPVPADTLDLSTGESLQVTEFRLRDREKYLINKINKSLKNMKEGSYGYCSSCDSEIGFPRLKARPVAELCIDCKEEQERLEKGKAKVRRNFDERSFFTNNR